MYMGKGNTNGKRKQMIAECEDKKKKEQTIHAGIGLSLLCECVGGGLGDGKKYKK